jgi:hypothetical protein
MSESVSFDRETATRVIRATKTVEGSNQGGGAGGVNNPGNQCITVRITSMIDDGIFAFQQERRIKTGWEEVTNGLTDQDGKFPAYTLDESDTTDLTDAHVTLVRIGSKDDSDKPIAAWVIVGAPEAVGQYPGMVDQTGAANTDVFDWIHGHSLMPS